MEQKMKGTTLKELLDAPSESAAVVTLIRGEVPEQRDLLNGDYNDDDGKVDAGNSSEDGGSSDMLMNLSDSDKTMLNQFRNLEWLKGEIRKNPELPWVMIARDVGRDFLLKVQEAERTQYETVTAAELLPMQASSPSEMAATRVKAIDKLGELAKWTPVRLVWNEREFLRLLESTLYISDYTDSIDIFHAGQKQRHIVKQIRQICSILTGLVLARDYEEGQRLIKDREFAELSSFFQACFEIGRRYKILNPDKMRDSYGKLMYFLMDSRDSHVSNMLEFDCVAPVKTVHDLLERKEGAAKLLADPLLLTAVREIYSEGQDRWQVDLALHQKEEATKELVAKYAANKPQQRKNQKSLGRSLFGRLWTPTYTEETDRLGVPQEKEWESPILTEEDVELAIYSLKDHKTFLRYTERPVDIMLRYLETYFDADVAEPDFSLAIRSGVNGARLSHQHSRQYQYVRQSLLLWREVLRNFMKLWYLADLDMLAANNRYQLRETGQGLNRIQNAPQVHRALTEIIRDVQQTARGWVGSSVIHLGDHNVPNALMFIDKYTQIPRFINPIVHVLEHIPKLYSSSRAIGKMIDDSYGSVEKLKSAATLAKQKDVSFRKCILADFFRHGFDGSGADNFFDAGSCIDGRLTSAWNWCSSIEKRVYYPIFLLTGFVGFDGKF